MKKTCINYIIIFIIVVVCSFYSSSITRYFLHKDHNYINGIKNYDFSQDSFLYKALSDYPTFSTLFSDINTLKSYFDDYNGTLNLSSCVGVTFNGVNALSFMRNHSNGTNPNLYSEQFLSGNLYLFAQGKLIYLTFNGQFDSSQATIPALNSTTERTIVTIKNEQYCPEYKQYFLIKGANYATGLLSINPYDSSNGYCTVTLSRMAKGTGYYQPSNGEWIGFSVIYPVQD